MEDSEPIGIVGISSHSANGNATTAGSDCRAGIERELASITREVFSEPFSFETACDPEIPDLDLRVINIDVRADESTIRAKEDEWHRRVIRELGTRAINYTLCVYRVTDDG
jgi:hypothetical protein